VAGRPNEMWAADKSVGFRVGLAYRRGVASTRSTITPASS
jgi:hypothetical protein